jgi:hypothetical protein
MASPRSIEFLLMSPKAHLTFFSRFKAETRRREIYTIEKTVLFFNDNDVNFTLYLKESINSPLETGLKI